MNNGTSPHAVPLRWAALNLVVLLLSLQGPAIQAQVLNEQVSLSLSTTFGAMKEVPRRGGRWAFPFSGGARIEFFGSFHLEFAWVHIFTHRLEDRGCFDGPCPKPDAVWGSSVIRTVGGGVSREFGVWKPFLGLAKGHGSEDQPEDLDEFDGPVWTWYAGIERWFGDRLAVMAEYRGFWQHWEHDFENISKNIHFQQHCLGVGLRYSLF